MNRIALFFILLATAGLAFLITLASPASAAVAHVPLDPGDTVLATESPSPYQSRTHSVLGHNVLWIETEAPALVAVRIQHAGGSTTDHITATTGYRLDDVLDDTAALQAQIEALQATSTETINQLLHANDELETQQGHLAGLQLDVAHASQLMAGQSQRWNQTLAAANGARLAAENIVVPEPDLGPAIAAGEAAQSAAHDAQRSTGKLLVFTIINSCITLALALATANKNGTPGLASMRDRVGQLIGRKAPEPAIETPHADSQVALEEQITANRNLAAELLPGQLGPGDASGSGVVPATAPGEGNPSTDLPKVSLATQAPIIEPPSTEPEPSPSPVESNTEAAREPEPAPLDVVPHQAPAPEQNPEPGPPAEATAPEPESFRVTPGGLFESNP